MVININFERSGRRVIEPRGIQHRKVYIVEKEMFTSLGKRHKKVVEC